MGIAYTFAPIGFVRSPYTQKFGIPRQPDLVPAADVVIVLEKSFSNHSVRGLIDFDYIWVQFVFHQTVDKPWRETVRPPRLGGDKKMGVFATRSPYRPNGLGLSLLRLLSVKMDEQGQVCLCCAGADLLNETPVLDIKPYLPFVEAKPEAASGFAPQAPIPLSVVWPSDMGHNMPQQVRDLITQSLAQDPRPAYHVSPERIYMACMANWCVRFRVAQGVVWVIAADPV